MNDVVSRDTARADYLRQLAMRPTQALDAWQTLNSPEQFLVLTQMCMFYDRGFVASFQAMANRRVRPSLEITVTNSPRQQQTPPALVAAGYRLQPGSTGTQYWVHPSGRQVWLIAPPKALPPPDLFPTRIEPNTADNDVLGQIDDLIQRYQRLEQTAAEVKRRRVSRNQSPAEYDQSRAYWWQDYTAWKREAQSFRQDLDNNVVQALPMGARAQLDQRIDELGRLVERPAQGMLEPLEPIRPR